MMLSKVLRTILWIGVTAIVILLIIVTILEHSGNPGELMVQPGTATSTPSGTTSTNPLTNPTTYTVPKDFPVGFPVEKGVQITANVNGNSTHQVISNYQYISKATTVSEASAIYTQYFKANNWNSSTTVNTETVEIITAMHDGDTYLITASKNTLQGQFVVVNVSLSEARITDWPADFPFEAGATVTNSVATTTTATTQMRAYFSNKTMDANVQLFKNYFATHGWDVIETDSKTTGGKFLNGTRLGVQLGVYLLPSSNVAFGKVQVQAGLSFPLNK
jgi:hypothetical protein